MYTLHVGVVRLGDEHGKKSSFQIVHSLNSIHKPEPLEVQIKRFNEQRTSVDNTRLYELPKYNQASDEPVH